MDESTPLLMSENETDSGDPNDATAKAETRSVDIEGAPGAIYDKAVPVDDKARDKAVSNKKKKGTKLTVVGAADLRAEIHGFQVRHALASKYFEKRQFWFFTIPQAVLTMAASIFAFVATTDLLNENQTIIVNVVVGSTSAIVVFLQTMSSICKYETRGAMHDAVSIDLSDLQSNLKMLTLKLGYVESSMAGTESQQADDREEDHDNENETYEGIIHKFDQSLVACKSIIPLELTGVWNDATSELNLASTDAAYGQFRKVYHPLAFLPLVGVNVRLKLFNILAEEIMDFPMFPFYLPNPKVIVKASMKRLRAELENSTTFWDGVNVRSLPTNHRDSGDGSPFSFIRNGLE